MTEIVETQHGVSLSKKERERQRQRFLVNLRSVFEQFPEAAESFRERGGRGVRLAGSKRPTYIDFANLKMGFALLVVV